MAPTIARVDANAPLGRGRTLTNAMQPETCDQCNFDGSRWTVQDAVQTVALGAELVEAVSQTLDPIHWMQRPRETTWSIAEYVDHLCLAFEVVRRGCEQAVATPGLAFAESAQRPFDPVVAEHNLVEVTERLAVRARTGFEFFSTLTPEDWKSTFLIGDEQWTVDHAVKHLCHDLMHHLADVAEIRHDLGEGFATMTGSITQLSCSSGGVPKTAMESALIDTGGVVGDVQAARRHHYSADVIAGLRDEGHSIAAGSAGENLTLTGVDWSLLRGGLVIEAGTVRMRLSAPAVPCSKNRQWFSDGDFSRMHHDVHPGWSRWYASVLQGGELRAGDKITIGSQGRRDQPEPDRTR